MGNASTQGVGILLGIPTEASHGLIQFPPIIMT